MRTMIRPAAAILLTLFCLPLTAGADETDLRLEYTGNLVLIPGGEFVMGSYDGGPDEGPAHRVRVGDFLLAARETTREEWLKVMGYDPSDHPGCPRCPVENVSWEEVQAFLGKLREATGRPFRLPTEAEWEYAAGGGSGTAWSGTGEPGRLGEYAVFETNSRGRPHPAGSKKANPFGLYDMSGNVWEWCADWYDADYYRHSPQVDPPGPPAGDKRVLRGGSWVDTPAYLMITNRNGYPPGGSNGYLGFRVALDAPL